MLSPDVYALTSDKNEPILIEADQVQIVEKTGLSTYTGNVKFQQGSIKIEADNIVIYTEKKKFKKAIASGSPAHFTQKPDKCLN